MLVSAKLLQNLSMALAGLGFGPEAVLRDCDLTWKDLEEKEGGDQRFPVEVLDRFWSAAVSVTNDSSIGVRVGALAKLDNFGVLGHVARASATLGDALLKTGRYLKLWNESIELSLLVESDRALLWCKSLARASRHYANGDAILATLFALSRELTAHSTVPDEIRFAHSSPPDDSRYREVFGAPLRFDRQENALVFAPKVLNVPISTHDSELGETLLQRASRLLDTLPTDHGLSLRARSLMKAGLKGGNPLVENIAAQLRIHPKTLARRLRDEGTGPREIRESLRRQLAEQYLAAPELNITEVAFLLGFSTSSAFNKACKRWFGMAPLAFRRRLQAS